MKSHVVEVVREVGLILYTEETENRKKESRATKITCGAGIYFGVSIVFLYAEKLFGGLKSRPTNQVQSIE